MIGDRLPVGVTSRALEQRLAGVVISPAKALCSRPSDLGVLALTTHAIGALGTCDVIWGAVQLHVVPNMQSDR